jgi:hypothetical protein
VAFGLIVLALGILLLYLGYHGQSLADFSRKLTGWQG